MSIPDPSPADAKPAETTPAATPPPGRKRVMSSAVWSMAGFGVMQSLRFLVNIPLTYLLVPQVFGLMSLVNVFIQGLHMFSDVGLGQSIVRSQRGEDPAFLHTAWTLQVVRGSMLLLAAALLAWPVAHFFQEPLLAWLLPVAGLTAAINGFNSTNWFTVQRHMALGRLVLLQVFAYIVGQGLTLWLLWHWRPAIWGQFMGNVLATLGLTATDPTSAAGFLSAGESVASAPLWWLSCAWAVVTGGIVSSSIEALGSHFFLPGIRHRFRWDRHAIHELVHYGKWIFVGTLCTFIADQGDRLVVGKVESLGLLGLYNLAVQLAQVPRNLMTNALTPQLVFPLYSRAHQAGQELRLSFAKIHPVAAGIAGYMATGILVAGPTLFRCVYPPSYHAAGWLLLFVMAGVWLTMLEALGGSVLWVLGQTKTSAASNAIKAGALPVFGLAGMWLGGFTGMLLGFVAADLGRYGNTATALRRMGLPVLRYDSLLTLTVGLFWLVAWACGGFVESSISHPKGAVWARFAVEVVGVTLLWSGLLVVAWRRGLLHGLRKGK